MRHRAVVAVSAVVALAAAGCGPSEKEAAPEPSSEAASTPTPTPSPVRRPVTIAFVGDVHFYAQLAHRLAHPKTALGPTIRYLKRADFTVANLETAITRGGTKAPKQFAFRAPPSAFPALREAGIDVVSMANNHGMDYGESGLRDSLAAIKKSHYPVVGIGEDAAEAYRPYYATVNGTRLAVIGATQVLDNNLITAWTATAHHAGLASAKNAPRLVKEVRRAREKADAVIVYVHWGAELRPCPLPRQKELAEKLVKAGADVIVGGHAHIPLGGGYLHGRYVDYGLGNYLFYSAHDKTARTGILEVTLKGRQVTKARWRPGKLVGGVPHLLRGTARKKALARWNRLRRCTGLDAHPPRG